MNIPTPDEDWLDDNWLTVCKLAAQGRNDYWYNNDCLTESVQEDYGKCAAAAKRGDKRAVHYITTMVRIRLTR